MSRRITIIVALVLSVSLGVSLAAAGGPAKPSQREATKAIKFAESDLFVEINSTDGDAGLQLALDGEAWKHIRMLGPDGRVLMDVTAQGTLEGYGLTGLGFESSEPPFAVFPLAKFKKQFPEGAYRFTGETVDGRALVGKARLTHDFPQGPVIVSPTEDGVLPRDNAVIRWNPVTKPAGIDIDLYQVIVTQEDPEREYVVELPASATSASVPAEFFELGRDYKVEVLAHESGGNQTITEIAFSIE